MSKKKNIFLVGLGNIGQWHLKSLLTLDKVFNVYCIEKDNYKLKIIKKELENKTKSFFFFNKFPPNIVVVDLLILATKSHERHLLFKKIQKKYHITNIIFEKIIATNLKNLNYIYKNLKISQKNKSYVNCPRRLWTSYQILKKKIVKINKIKFNVTGYNWNIASNLIHIIDLYCYLTNTKKIKIVGTNFGKYFFLKKQVKFYGKIKLRGPRGDIEIEDKFFKNSKLKTFLINIETKNFIFNINEKKQKISIFDKTKKIKSFKTFNQSQLTADMSRTLLSGKKINLCTMEETVNHHKIVYKIFNKFLRFFNIKKNNLYIT